MGASGERRGDRAGVMPNPSDRHDIMPLLSSAEVGFIRLRPTYERPNLGKPKFGCESGDPYSSTDGYGSPLTRGRQLNLSHRRLRSPECGHPPAPGTERR